MLRATLEVLLFSSVLLELGVFNNLAAVNAWEKAI